MRLLALWLWSCDRTTGTLPPPPTDVADTGATLPVEPTFAPVDPDLPLVRELLLETGAPSEVRVTWTDGDGTGVATSPAATSHRIPLLRLRPDRDHEVTIEVTSGGVTTTRAASFRTDPLPDPFPAVTVRAHDPALAEPGDTLVAVDSGPTNYHVVLTPEGEVVWLWRQRQRVMELQLVGPDRLLGVENKNGGPFEITWTGRELRRFAPAADAVGDQIPVDVRLFHHDAQLLPDGRVLALTNDAVTAPTYPASYTDPSDVTVDAEVRVDRVVVLAADGTVDESYPMSDHVPLDRIGYEGMDDGSGEANWGHSNGIVADEARNALLVSMRNQDAVVSLDRATGATRWILANPANWPPEQEALRLRPVGTPFRWPYHQHAPEWTGDRVMVYDNGNHQASPFTGEEKLGPSETATRIVEYRVDEAARTVEQLWSFEPPGGPLFTPYLGDADHLPGGTVLADFAQVTYEGGRPASGGAYVRLVEFVPETGEVAWDVELRAPPGAPQPWSSFRAQRLPEWSGVEE